MALSPEAPTRTSQRRETLYVFVKPHRDYHVPFLLAITLYFTNEPPSHVVHCVTETEAEKDTTTYFSKCYQEERANSVALARW